MAADAYAYDLLSLDDTGARSWLGRCHRDCFFAQGKGMRIPADGTLRFELVAISKGGLRSAPALASARV